MVNAVYICKYCSNLFVDPDAIKFAKKLDRLPLVLVIAGVYLD
jgi:hypothetical protein